MDLLKEEIVEDVGIYPRMIELLGALHSESEQRGLPGLCFLGVLPFGPPTLDCGDCEEGTCSGRGWVRLASAFAAKDFPNQDAIPGPCNGGMAYQLEVGIVRCASPFTEEGSNGEAPTVAESLAYARQQLADMAAMRATFCQVFNARDLVIGEYTPVNGGGCGGGSWLITVR